MAHKKAFRRRGRSLSVVVFLTLARVLVAVFFATGPDGLTVAATEIWRFIAPLVAARYDRFLPAVLFGMYLSLWSALSLSFDTCAVVETNSEAPLLGQAIILIVSMVLLIILNIIAAFLFATRTVSSVAQLYERRRTWPAAILSSLVDDPSDFSYARSYVAALLRGATQQPQSVDKPFNFIRLICRNLKRLKADWHVLSTRVVFAMVGSLSSVLLFSLILLSVTTTIWSILMAYSDDAASQLFEIGQIISIISVILGTVFVVANIIDETRQFLDDAALLRRGRFVYDRTANYAMYDAFRLVGFQISYYVISFTFVTFFVFTLLAIIVVIIHFPSVQSFVFEILRSYITATVIATVVLKYSLEFFCWAIVSTDGRFLIRFPSLANFVDFCLVILNVFFGVLSFTWRVVKVLAIGQCLHRRPLCSCSSPSSDSTDRSIASRMRAQTFATAPTLRRCYWMLITTIQSSSQRYPSHQRSSKWNVFSGPQDLESVGGKHTQSPL
jgi:hypothetical protein